MNLTTIIVQVRDDKNKHLCCLKIDYTSPTNLIHALNNSLPGFLTHGILEVESNEMGLTLNGIPFQKGNAQEERSKHYQETGN